MIKVGLIGIGGMGFVHFNAYKNIEGVKIVAVADVRTDMAKEKINDESIHVYSTLEELLANESVDAVDICTPSYLHAELSIKALEAGLHVICEKPMSISSAETARMMDAAKKSGKFYMTAHVVRFMAPYMYLKSVIDSGELGAPVYFMMKRISGIPTWSWQDWMRDYSKSGGAPIDLSIHDIDFIQYVFGEPKEIGGVFRRGDDNNDYIVSDLIYDNFSVNITGGWFNAKIPFQAEYTAIFENGIIVSTGKVVTKNGETVKLDVGSVSENTGINLSGVDGYAGEIAYFYDCVRRGVAPTAVTPESSAYSVELVEKIMAKAIKV